MLSRSRPVSSDMICPAILRPVRSGVEPGARSLLFRRDHLSGEEKSMKPRKPQDYVLEVGLDAEVGPDTDGYYPLVRSISRWDRSRRPAVWVPAWSTEFQPEDRIA